MEKIDAFSLEKHEGPYEKWPRKTRLYFDGRDTGTKIAGYVVEGQYRCNEGFLLITSQDCPFEESNDFILLGPTFRRLATNAVLRPYNSFLLHAHWPVSDSAVLLHYYDRLFFTLSIENRAFGLGLRLGVTRFEGEPEKDPAASASILELEQRLEAIREMTRVRSWRTAWSALGVSEHDDSLLHELVRRYAEPHRKYHTMQHLDECFAKLPLLRSAAEHPEEIELALWFHDAIYETRREDNEERSADWARSCVLAAGASSAAADRIHALVMVTRHDALPGTTDERILVDVDLSILGADAQRFDEYESQVRAEYAWVADDVFRSRRRSILQGFLARPSIYGTQRFAALYEAKARSNLRRSIAKLGG